MKLSMLTVLPALFLFACNNSSDDMINKEAYNEMETGKMEAGNVSPKKTTVKFVEGEDYMIYERVRITDNVGFVSPQEAYSVLLPKGWTHQGNIHWNQPGSSCPGTFNMFTASSSDGTLKFDIFPDKLYSWTSNAMLRSMQQQDNSGYCMLNAPMNADAYLKQVFLPEIGNPEIVSIESNQGVINKLNEGYYKRRQELVEYGAGNINFIPEAVTVNVKWNDGKRGILTLSVSNIENMMPNNYNGTYDMLYTTVVSNRMVLTYPGNKEEEGKKLMAARLPGTRTNPYWQEAVEKFWKDVRQRNHIVHLGKIKAMDDQTRRMGEQAIASGKQRSAEMDNQIRSWEARQQSNDRMHNEFIKTIRGVENYQDATGKFEMSSGYNHAWSRNDGTSFILSDNPNFDPSSVFQDQNWQQMRRVD